MFLIMGIFIGIMAGILFLKLIWDGIQGRIGTGGEGPGPTERDDFNDRNKP